MNKLYPSTLLAIFLVLLSQEPGPRTDGEKVEGEIEIVTVTEIKRESTWVVKDWESSNESSKSEEI